jgi:excisionase family DNA binding protein
MPEANHGTPNDTLSLAAAAKRLGVSPHTLRNWAKYQQRVPYLRLGRRFLFRPEDLATFEAANRVAARDETRR